MTAPAKTKTYPIVEVFGPTIQGEGWPAGLATYFVRVGGCDWRCSWCDSLHAVLPEHVRQAPRLTAEEIVQQLGYPHKARWVTLSGGNPALLELGPLVRELHDAGLYVAVETQGSRWRDWLADVDHLTVSPKPPSSAMAGAKEREQVQRFMAQLLAAQTDCSLKIVVFDYDDLTWALDVARVYNWLPFYISVGTDALEQESLEATAARYAEVCELVATNGTPTAKRARVLPQLHVIAWGHRRGV